MIKKNQEDTVHSIYERQFAIYVHVRYMSYEVEPRVLWALRVLLPLLAKLIED